VTKEQGNKAYGLL